MRNCRLFEAFADVDRKREHARRDRGLPIQVRIDEVARDLRIGSAGSLEQSHAAATLELNRFNDHLDRVLLAAGQMPGRDRPGGPLGA